MKKLLGVLLSLLIFALTLYGLLRLFEVSGKEPQKEEKKTTYLLKRGGDEKFFPYGTEVALPANSSLEVSKTSNGEVLYRVTYDYNQYSLRALPLLDPKAAKEHLIFAGDSYTFGEGLPLEETFPYLVEQKFRKFNTYSVSFRGGGVATVLRFMDFVNLTEFVREREGTMIYVFIENHLSRWFGAADYLSWAPENFPFYKVENGKVVYQGKLRELPFFQNFKLMERAGLKDTALRLGHEGDWGREELGTFALAVKELKFRYQKLFPKGEFLFMFHPSPGISAANAKVLMEELEKQGISYADPRGFYGERLTSRHEENFDYEIPHDGHPNFKMNQLVLEYLEEKVLR